MAAPGDIPLLAALPDRDLRREGLVVAEGRLVTERLLSSPDFVPLIVACVPALAPAFEIRAGGRCPVRVLAERDIAAIAGFPFHRGVLAVASRPPPLSAARLFAEGRGPRRVLLLPSTSDPENMGALIRSASAFGFETLILGPASCDPLSRRSLRVSMGAALSIRTAILEGPSELASLRRGGLVIAAAVLDPAALSLREWALPPRLALAIGNEYSGLEAMWLAEADVFVRIPMEAGPDSLNAAAAGAVLMYETSRRG